MKKMPRVLHIISSMGQGGAERQLIELVSANKDHAICQLISGGIFEEVIKNQGITLYSRNKEKFI